MAKILLARPKQFAVSYSINPWMNPKSWNKKHKALAEQQWEEFASAISQSASTSIIEFDGDDTPDITFVANAAVVKGGTALMATFANKERQGEQAKYMKKFFSLAGQGAISDIITMPEGIVLEGAGDCVWDQFRKIYWLGYGQRSHAQARLTVSETFATETIILQLINPNFYHLDTALCPLSKGHVIYYPQAFNASGLALLHKRIPPPKRIELTLEDANQFSANAVNIGDKIHLSNCSPELEKTLNKHGYKVIRTNLSAFHKSGGSAWCLTLRLDS